ncbi:MAG: AAA family ATPase [Anaerolineales bacterium]|nr:AAA family ATPase [Anaerolineales bacterium]MCB8960856.1 AAA family ATPase [Ardenticatenales bacterium]
MNQIQDELKQRSDLQAREDLQTLLSILPAHIRQELEQNGRQDQLLEIVMDLGRTPSARYVDGEVVLSNVEVTAEEIATVEANIGDFDDDNRAGIARTLHRISGIRNRRGDVVGLTLRVGRAVYGTIDIIVDIIEEGHSILLLGRPGVGKTTMLREMARVLAEKKRVVIVDTSNEIGGDGDIPHPAVGRARRMQVARSAHQHETMIEAVENHNPEVIIIDEIGREQEAAAARTINERGVQLIGTAHGNTLENLLLNPTLSDLVGGIESVTLSDEEARRRGTQKTVLERRAPPTFDVLIEIQDRERLAIHSEVATAVDAMLRGRSLGVELRYRDANGQIQIERTETTAAAESLGQQRETRDMRDPRRPRGNGTVRPAEGRSRGQYELSNGAATAEDRPQKVEIGGSEKQLRVFPYGVARNRLVQAARRLGVDVEIAAEVDDADVMVTLKSYYRRRRRVISDAEKKRKPVYVLRANTVSQMQDFLARALNLEVAQADPFEVAIAQAEDAIAAIHAGVPSVDLPAAGPAIRRYQHQMARQADLVSHSYGKEPNRHVRIFADQRNS